MQANIGTTERFIRFAVAGFLLLVMVVAGISVEAQAAVFVISLILFVTAWNRFCPVYALFGLNSPIRRNAHAK